MQALTECPKVKFSKGGAGDILGRQSGHDSFPQGIYSPRTKKVANK